MFSPTEPPRPLYSFFFLDNCELLTSWRQCCQAKYITNSSRYRRRVFPKVHRSVWGYRRPDEWDSDGVTGGFTVCMLSGKKYTKEKKKKTVGYKQSYPTWSWASRLRWWRWVTGRKADECGVCRASLTHCGRWEAALYRSGAAPLPAACNTCCVHGRTVSSYFEDPRSHNWKSTSPLLKLHVLSM